MHANGNKNKAGVATLVSDKIDFKTRAVTRDKEGHYTIIKGSIKQEDVTLINNYTPQVGTPKYINQILTDIMKEIDSCTIIADFINSF